MENEDKLRALLEQLEEEQGRLQEKERELKEKQQNWLDRLRRSGDGSRLE